MNLSRRTAPYLNQIISNFLKKHDKFSENPSWEIRESNVGGFGVFTTRDVAIGEVIFIDVPVILGPRCIPNCPILCVSCFRKTDLLKPCISGCGLPVCSNECQNSSFHQQECRLVRQLRHGESKDICNKLFENLTPLKSLFLDQNDKDVVLSLIAHNRDRHGHEVDTLKNGFGFEFSEDDEKFMKFVCCVMDANAFEVSLSGEKGDSSLRGLYPLGSLANHSCTPNLTHVFNEHQEMVAKAAVFIPKNTELVHSYTRIIWDTTTRLYHLHCTKHFICKCLRCQDRTEFGTYMGSVLCKKCRGIVSPVNPYKSYGKWQCQDCKTYILGKDVKTLTTLLGSILRDLDSKGFEFIYNFLKGKLKTVVPDHNQIAIAVKYKLIWLLGHMDGYKYKDLTLELLDIKEELCKDILFVLNKLQCGQCKLRGLLLYELYCCQREKIQRLKSNKQIDLYTNEIQNNLDEILLIMRYDVAAPDEIKKFLDCDLKE
ncbi:SET domain-containing protein SmydA-8 [Sitophilus oryzae]|uniref:SET domain-containing protein SmydA-8 n=1 Tax=Sitophilus oryzae TaxID=7048 RepID=A0A6J2XUK5_SITOR|nr:SET domain-containing protein SmydA-8 [Sitophilus oryzae]